MVAVSILFLSASTCIPQTLENRTSSAAVSAEEPFPFKVRDKDDLKLYLDADEKLKNLSLKREYYDMMLRYTEEILKQISNRTYQIKNAIEWRRFTSGYG